MLPDTAPPRANFLSLPLEIRLEIYSLLLCLAPLPPHHNQYYSTGPTVHPQGEHAVHGASLLLTSRQLHAEASPFLYGRNVFLAHPTLLASFPRLRGWYPPVAEAAALGRIRRFHLQVRLDCDYGYGAEEAGRAFTGAEELTVQVAQSTWLGAGRRNLRPFEAVRAVGRARVRGSTAGFGDYAAWLEGAMESGDGEEVGEFEAEGDHWAKRLIPGNH